jgi:hypothetical protein
VDGDSMDRSDAGGGVGKCSSSGDILFAGCFEGTCQSLPLFFSDDGFLGRILFLCEGPVVGIVFGTGGRIREVLVEGFWRGAKDS